jgi:hypothetical protein
MSDLAAGTKDFERWLIKQRVRMPPDLNAKAEHAVFTLRELDQPEAEQSPTCMHESAEALMAFEAAYSAWLASQDDKSARKAVAQKAG